MFRLTQLVQTTRLAPILRGWSCAVPTEGLRFPATYVPRGASAELLLDSSSQCC